MWCGSGDGGSVGDSGDDGDCSDDKGDDAGGDGGVGDYDGGDGGVGRVVGVDGGGGCVDDEGICVSFKFRCTLPMFNLTNGAVSCLLGKSEIAGANTTLAFKF